MKGKIICLFLLAFLCTGQCCSPATNNASSSTVDRYNIRILHKKQIILSRGEGQTGAIFIVEIDDEEYIIVYKSEAICIIPKINKDK